ncbi:MAG TPA: hypothetical protein VHT02_09680, partial [Methylocella sp.]|nr:hypothetical protein [Methylocella sp.]
QDVRYQNYPGKIVRPIPSPAGDTHCFALLKPWKQSEIERLGLRPKLSPWIFTARSTLNLILLSASPSLSCRSVGFFVSFTLFRMVKMVLKKFHKKLSVCKT